MRTTETGGDEPLGAVAREVCAACAELRRILPVLALSAPYADEVHRLAYTAAAIETAVHQFVATELLPVSGAHGRRLDIAVIGAHGACKPSVKASLLAGGIASLLHLFAHLLHSANRELETLPRPAASPYTSTGCACAVASTLIWSHRSGRRRAFAQLLAVAAAFSAATAAARALAVRRLASRLRALHARLQLSVQLWYVATSVLDRAQRSRKYSYLALDRLDDGAPSSLASALGGSSTGSDLSGGMMGAKRNSRDWSRLPATASFPQLIVEPDQAHFVDPEHMSAFGKLFDSCVPYSGCEFWWDLHPLIGARRRD